MNHIAEHFQQGADISMWNARLGKRKRIGDDVPGLPFGEDDDDNDDDDDEGSDNHSKGSPKTRKALPSHLQNFASEDPTLPAFPPGFLMQEWSQ